MGKMVKKTLTKDEKELYKNLGSRFWRLNNLYWIVDEQGNKVKFVLNAVQLVLYRALHWLNIIPKSRQHGITTFICLFFLDACLFNENVRAAIICHRFETAKKIFRDKVKFAYDHLPEILKEAMQLSDKKGKSDELLFWNNSSIYVDTNLRGGTFQYLHVSEYAYICAHAADRAQEIKRAGLNAIHEGSMCFVESTSEGVGNDFHVLCENALKKGELTRLDFKLHFFGWHDDPRNRLKGFSGEIPADMAEYFDGLEVSLDKTLDLEQRGWYLGQKRLMGIDIYKEQPSTLAEAFTACIEGSYFGREMTLAREEDRIAFVPYDSNAKVFTFWDTGNMYVSIWFFQFKGEKINAIDHYFDDLGQGLPHYAKVLQDRGYVYGSHFAGPDIDPEHGSNKKSFHTGEKTVDIARGLGIKFQIISPHSVNDRIRCTKDMIGRTWFDEEKCKTGYTGLTNFRRRKNNQLSTQDRPVFFDEPVKDTIDIHIADSFGHMAIWYASRLLSGRGIGEVDVVELSRYSHYKSERPRHIGLLGFKNKRRAV